MEKTDTPPLTRRLAQCLSKPVCRVAFLFSPETTQYDYPDTDLDLQSLGGDGIELAGSLADPDVDFLLMTAHGGLDLLEFLYTLRNDGFARGIGLWLWDNHCAPKNHRAYGKAADILFPSHWYCVDDLDGTDAMVGPQIPACAAEWSPTTARTLFDTRETRGAPRSDQLLAGYVDYAFSPRKAFLDTLRATLPDRLAMRVMAMHDRSDYLGKSRSDRFVEWLCFKTSLAVPMYEDLSTRVFAGLLAGHVVVIDGTVRDIDRVFPKTDPLRQGLVVFEERTPDAVAKAHARALEIYDAEGPDGARRRHEAVLAHHMTRHRIAAMLDHLRALRRQLGIC